jgi:hypothetical protein
MHEKKIITLTGWKILSKKIESYDNIQSILSSENPEAILKTLSAQTLYLIIKNSTQEEIIDLLAIINAEKIKNFMDFDVWLRDRIVPEKLITWFENLALCSKNKLKDVVNALDIELKIFFLSANINVYENTDDLPRLPQDAQTGLTPDNKFIIEFKCKSNEIQTIIDFINSLYEANLAQAFNIMCTLGQTTPSELEETLYELKKNRLDALGFPDYFDALGLYAYIKPENRNKSQYKKITMGSFLDEKNYPPSLFISGLKEEDFINKVLNEISDFEKLENFAFELMCLVNKNISCNFKNLDDLNSIKEVTSDTIGYLNIALETLSNNDLANAQNILNTFYLQDLFRVGYSEIYDLKLKLEKNLPKYLKNNLWIFGKSLENLIEGLLFTRPKFSENNEAVSFRNFRNFSEINYTSNYVDYINFIIRLFNNILKIELEKIIKLTFTKTNIQSEKNLTLGIILNTMLINKILFSNFSFEFIALPETKKILSIFKNSENNIKNDFISWILSIKKLENNDAIFLTKFVNESVDQLIQEIKNIDQDNFNPIYTKEIVIKME